MVRLKFIVMADVKFSEDTPFPVLTVLNGLEKLAGLNADGDGNAKVAVETIRKYIRPFKRYRVAIDYQSSVFSKRVETSDFGAVTFTFTNPSNGLIVVTASSPVFTDDKTFVPGSTLDAGSGNVYFLTGIQISTTVVNFSLRLHDGTAATTPFFISTIFEIQVND